MSREAPPDLYAKFNIGPKTTAIEKIKQLGAYPFFPEFQPGTGPSPVELQWRGRTVINFGSNDYLGLSRDPQVVEAALDATRRYGTSCSGSRLLNGTTDLHVKLEENLAQFLGKESAVVVSTGFQTNLAAMAVLAGKRDVIVADEFCHASINDGIALSNAKEERFRHNDYEMLEQVLRHNEDNAAHLVVIEGVYSVRGDTADLPIVCDLCERYGAKLFIDDGHGIGVLGAHGRGTADHYGVEDRVDILSGTFSKAFAGAGGFIAGDRSLIDYIRHNSSPFIFSASMAPGTTAAVLAALKRMQAEPALRERVMGLAKYARNRLRDSGFNVIDGIAPTIIVQLDCESGIYSRSLLIGQFTNQLLENGFYVNPVMGQAAPTPILRIAVMSQHNEQQIDALVSTMSQITQAISLPSCK